MLNIVKILLAFVLIIVLSNFVPNNSWKQFEKISNEFSKYQNPTQSSTQNTINPQAMPPTMPSN